MTSQNEHAFPYHRSPRDIRDESFTHRMRGLDEGEVREYLDLLADQIEALEWEHNATVAELERLRARDEQVKEHPRTTPSPVPETAPEGVQAAAVLSHAQDAADQLLDAASRRAQEIIAAAQTQLHETVRLARIRTQDRMQSLYDELDGDLYRLGEAMRLSGPDRPPPAPPSHDV